jgi:dUTP pyrophosphatase
MPGAVAPSKRAASDSGFDLTLIDRWKTHGAIEFFRTGIRVQPAFGWYFDLVPRSSISKSGYMLANSVGIIDRGYTGEIFVPLVKVDPNAPDLELPNRLVQIIPRQIIAAELVEVTEFEDTVRGDGAFGSSGK